MLWFVVEETIVVALDSVAMAKVVGGRRGFCELICSQVVACDAVFRRTHSVNILAASLAKPFADKSLLSFLF